VREFAVRAATQDDDPQAEVIVRVVEGRDLLRAFAAEIADEREAAGEGLPGGAAAARSLRRHEGERQHEREEQRQEPACCHSIHYRSLAWSLYTHTRQNV